MALWSVCRAHSCDQHSDKQTQTPSYIKAWKTNQEIDYINLPPFYSQYTSQPVCLIPSVLWHCWLGSRKGIRPVKTEWWGVGMVICLERGAELHIAQLMSLPLTVSSFSKIQIGFTFLVPAHLGSPGKRAVIRVCVCVYKSTFVSRHHQLRSGRFCWCKVLLSACLCWRQPVNSD